MEILSKKELEEDLGKASFWKPNRTVNLFHYMAGIEVFDEQIDPNSYLQVPNIADLEIRPGGLVIRMMHKFKQYRVGIKNENLVSIDLEDKEQVYQNEEKSVVGRAVVGGLLFGPVGAIVGGMSGLQSGQEKAQMPDLIAIFSIGKENNIERVIMLSIKYKEKLKAIDFITKNFKEKFNIK